MINRRVIEIMVGFFMIAGIMALIVLALEVSGLTNYAATDHYQITAIFDNIGSLKVRAPITIAGVRVGEVSAIGLDKQSFRAKVTLFIEKKDNIIPVDSSLQILTAGLLGANYIAIIPGFSDKVLQDGDQITDTHPALILENMIGQFLYKIGQDKKSADKEEK